MSLTSRKMRNSFTPSNKNNGSACNFGSDYSNQRNISSPKESNQQIN